FRIRPERDFTRILSVVRPGKTGETYAFNRQGIMLSESRFDDELKKVGLIPDRPDAKSILNMELLDPQANLLVGEHAKTRRSELSLTRLIAAATTSGGEGVNVEGYRDYRGVPTIGAYKWLPEYNFGVATEYDLAEAYRPLYILRWTFWSLFSLLALGSIAI